MLAKKARLDLPLDEAFIEPAVYFVVSFARRFAMAEARQAALAAALRAAVSLVMEANRGGKSDTPVTLEVAESDGLLRVDLHNRGVPIILGAAGGFQLPYAAKFREASLHADRLSLENRGRKGQVVVLEFKLGVSPAARSASAAPRKAEIPETEAITIRELGPDEEQSLSRLFYLVYGYDYINESVYYPEKLKAMRQSGDLLSVVAARSNGRLVGHIGLLRKSAKPPVYEAAMGITDPAIKSRGLFGRIFTKTMEKVRSTPMQYCLFDFVTNHDLSQKHIAKYGTRELALFVGCQSSKTQARLPKLGLGPDPAGMDRYSILLSVIPTVERPFGRKVTLPENIGEPFGFLLAPLGVEWTPASRFQPLPQGGRFNTRLEPAQSAVYFDLIEPGAAAIEGIAAEWADLVADGYAYAAVETSVEVPASGAVFEGLSSHGFFAAGFIPYGAPDRLGFRYQAVGPAGVAMDQIKVATEPAERLLELVRKDFESTRLP
ncbi:MAG: hypothetical protein HY924_07280 [Elusimicrobia bacterium]|nr:hypothetical protein [Elusimicrobiota bacterium]